MFSLYYDGSTIIIDISYMFIICFSLKDPRYLLRKYHWYADQSHLASKVTGRPTPDKVHDETGRKPAERGDFQK
jgi:hypothetical protein